MPSESRTHRRGGGLPAPGLRALAAIAVAVTALATVATAGAATTRALATAPSNSSLPTVSGIARDGATLTADPGSWDGDTPISFAYQWESCNASGAGCAAIGGATATTYVIATSDVGATLRVTVTASNATGSKDASSSVTGVVAAAGNAPASSALPVVSGTLQQGATLTSTGGSWNGSTPITFAYKWQRCDSGGASCALIAGETAQTYTLAAADVGKTVRSVVTATNAAGVGTAYSAVSGVILAANAPVATVSPAITGTAQVGQTLTVTSGTWSGTTPISYAYQWQRCDSAGASCIAVSGATAQTYALTSTDVGHTLRVTVTATNAAGSSATLTSPSGLVASVGNAPVNTAAPTFTGNVQQASTITVNVGSWNGTAPISYSYAWQRCDSAGNNCVWFNAGQTYTIGTDDVGHRLRAQVTATNAAGTGSASTALTNTIVARTPVNTSLPAITGILEQGQTLSWQAGSWAGVQPISFTYQWARSNSSGGYDPITGATATTYTLTSADVGHRLLVQVKAQNSVGTAFANSQPTAVVSAAKSPRNTGLPMISGTPRVGERLTLATGSWTTPTPLKAVTQYWLRCDTAGNDCKAIPGATARSYVLTAADLGKTLRATVKAENQGGFATATSAATAVVAAAAAKPLAPAGAGTVPVASVALPNRLVVSNVKFTPTQIASRAPFLGRFRVTDSQGRPVSGALVYVVGLPYGWIAAAPEQPTGQDGWATIQLTPTAKLPLGKGNALVLFVRARKPGDSILAGVSTRRLVQVTIR